MKIRRFLLIFWTVGFLTACVRPEPSETAVSNPTATHTAVPVPSDTPQPPSTVTPTASAVEEPTAEEETSSPEEPEPEAPAAEVESVPEPEVIQPVVETVSIEAADGLAIQATYYGPGGVAPFPGIILLHILGSDRQVWADNGFAETLVMSGYAVLAVDMRGHGETGGEQDWVKAEDDLLRAWAWLTGRDEVDGARTAVVGASIGSNMALRLAADESAILTAVLLSPGLDYRGVTTEDALEQYGVRPLLIVASSEDAYAADSSRTLADQTLGEARLHMYDDAGHGTDMFTAQPDLADIILEWLRERV